LPHQAFRRFFMFAEINLRDCNVKMKE